MDRYEYEYSFQFWNKKANSLIRLQDYIKEVIDKNSKNYIPISDRIAIFDFDGTIYGELAPIYAEWWMFKERVLEDESFEGDSEIIEIANKIKKAGEERDIPDNLEILHAKQNPRAYEGMTLKEFETYTKKFISKNVIGFEKMTYKEAFYLPMIEIIQYLQINKFKIYINSGSDRFFCRIVLEEGKLNIPKENIIGTEIKLEGKKQKGKDGLYYIYSKDEEVIRTGELLLKNIKANKVSQIERIIGKKPVLSFGNSNGDRSMSIYVINNNKYLSAAFMLIADDEIRDYGNIEKASKNKLDWEKEGFIIISMKNDFKTIYKEGVNKIN